MNPKRTFVQPTLTAILFCGLALFPGGSAVKAQSLSPGEQLEKLLTAIAVNNTNAAFQMLEANTNLVRLFRGGGKLPLHEAASMGNVAMMKRLVELGADIDASGDTYASAGSQRTPLHVAISLNQPAACRWLLEAGADPNRMAFGYTTPLHLAFTEHREEMAGWLLDFGADPFREKRFVNDRTTPFELAITHGSGGLVPRMLAPRRSNTAAAKAGAQALKEISVPLEPRAIRLIATNGVALLTIAAQRGELEAVEALLKAGAVPRADGRHDYSTIQAFALSEAQAAKAAGFQPQRWKQIRELLEKNGASCDAFAATALGEIETARQLVAKQPKLTGSRDHLGETPLHWAVRTDQLPLTSFWLEAGIPPSAVDSAGRTALHIAAETGLIKHVERLLAAHSPTNLRATNGRTPLDAAIHGNQQAIIRLLLEAKPSEQSAGRGVTTPLHEAAAGGNISAITAFATPTNLEARNELGFTPLHLAAKSGQLGAAALLIDKGAKVNARDPDGNTVLHLILLSNTHWISGQPSAAWIERMKRDPQKEKFLRTFTTPSGYTSAREVARSVAFFLAVGADATATNNAGKTVLQMAVVDGMLFDQDRATLLPLLQQGGGKIDERDANGDTALHRAAREVYAPNIESLIAAGADINATNHLGRTPLHAAVEKLGGWGDSLPFSEILKAKPNVNAQDNEGLTPLHVLAKSDSSYFREATKALLDAGADPNLRDKRGRTPALVSLTGKWPWSAARESLGQLAAAGTKLDVADEQGRTPLHYFAAMGRGGQDPLFFAREAADTLASAKLDFNATDRAGDTPLHLAARSGSGEMFEWLRSHGARLDVTNAAGETPRQIAARKTSPFARFNFGPTADVVGAAQRGEIETLRRSLTNEPALINAASSTGETALRVAARNGQTNTADALIQMGAAWDAVSATLLGRTDALKDILARQPDAVTNMTDGKTLLHLAVESGNVAVIEILLSAGADVNARARSGFSPVGLASLKKQTAVAGLLRSRGARGNIFDAVFLDSPERAAALLQGDKSLALATNAFGFTPAQLAAALDREQILNTLLDHRVPPDQAADRLRISPLHIAAAYNRTNAVALLLKRGAKKEVMDAYGFTPLHYAAAWGSTEVTAQLLKRGANPNAAVKPAAGAGMNSPFGGAASGGTALHFAALTGHTNVIALLLKARADVNVTDAFGQTPLDLTRPSNRLEPGFGGGPFSLPGTMMRVSLGNLGMPGLPHSAAMMMTRFAQPLQVSASLLEQAGGKPGTAPPGPFRQ